MGWCDVQRNAGVGGEHATGRGMCGVGGAGTAGR